MSKLWGRICSSEEVAIIWHSHIFSAPAYCLLLQQYMSCILPYATTYIPSMLQRTCNNIYVRLTAQYCSNPLAKRIFFEKLSNFAFWWNWLFRYYDLASSAGKLVNTVDPIRLHPFLSQCEEDHLPWNRKGCEILSLTFGENFQHGQCITSPLHWTKLVHISQNDSWSSALDYWF